MCSLDLVACAIFQVFKLTRNGITCKGATTLAKALRSASCGLSYLDLSTNEIGNAGAEALAGAIGVPDSSSKLQVLELEQNKVRGSQP